MLLIIFHIIILVKFNEISFSLCNWRLSALHVDEIESENTPKSPNVLHDIQKKINQRIRDLKKVFTTCRVIAGVMR